MRIDYLQFRRKHTIWNYGGIGENCLFNRNTGFDGCQLFNGDAIETRETLN
jgi:hypothetical protein